jgi:hypothetical protein
MVLYIFDRHETMRFYIVGNGLKAKALWLYHDSHEILGI